ncbi:MAG: DUF1501 domain-containing protein [Planctomycetes bacterium]|nr:DUF1501 domain-containing protein [Planctomycetota bacterium]MCB9891722.1 DUF1501 domain-containing protein [Planctomycetota bacterium]
MSAEGRDPGSFPCQRHGKRRVLTRRDWLARSAMGFGSLAFASLLQDEARAVARRGREDDVRSPLAPRKPHFLPKARRVIYLYMDGGPSQVDTFDPKERLAKEHGTPFKMKIEPTQFNNIGNTLKSPWKFRRYGSSGLPVSDLFPHVGKHADKLCVIRSMTSQFSEHTNANYFLHTGLGLSGRPSMGAWMSYGLGSENQDLPGFVVIDGGLIPPGGLDCFSSGFLPASYQGSIFRPQDPPVANIRPHEKTSVLQREKLTLMRALDQGLIARSGRHDEIESAINNYELAYRMQSAVPELTDLRGESEATRRGYGLESSFQPTRIFGTQCLLARRLMERGVRFVELTCPRVTNSDRWDQHSNLKKNHGENALAVDQPIGALLADLEARGLLDETLVVWSGEFGRTPFAQGSNGRDHNPFGFSLWMAGAGVKGGTTYGATDEYGYHAVENRVEIYDLHATMLHLLGIDHERLTVRFSGRDMRLTDVHGQVLHDVLA